MVGNWFSDDLEVDIQKHSEIFLCPFDDVLDALVESVDELEVGLVVVSDGGEDLPSSFSVLGEKFDDFIAVEEIHRFVEEGDQASLGEVLGAFHELYLPLLSTYFEIRTLPEQ